MDQNHPPLRVGVDVGGTKILAVALQGEEVIAQSKIPTPQSGSRDDVLDTIVQTARDVDPDGVASHIGVGFPGPVDPPSGDVLTTQNIAGFSGRVPVASMLTEALGKPAVVENDVNAATLAEQRLGAGRGVNDLLGLFLGSGVGGGLVLDGELRHGPRGMAGEVGHAIVAAFGEPGLRSTEDHAGRHRLEDRVRALAADGQEVAIVEAAGDGPIKSKRWSTAVKAGDPIVTPMIDDAATAVAALIASVIVIVDIELVVIGGGLGERLGRPFRERVAEHLDDFAFGGVAAELVPSKLADLAGAVGAACLDPRAPASP